MMNKFDFYSLYFKDSRAFIDKLSEYNEDSLAVADELITKKKLLFETDREAIYEKVYDLIRHEDVKSERLERVFAALLTEQRFTNVKTWIRVNLEFNLQSSLRIIVNIIATSHFNDNESFFNDISIKLCDLLYLETRFHSDILFVLMQMCSNETICRTIVSRVLFKTMEGRNDSASLQTLCCFFNKMCEMDVGDLAYDQILKLCFGNSGTVARKQGVFVIKALIQHKKLSPKDEESFKKFVMVVETLEESQHLILPTMNLVKTLDFSALFSEFPFMLYQMIMNHDSSIVKNWGIKYVLSLKTTFNYEEILSILNALNSSSQFQEDGQVSIESSLLTEFVERNFDAIFKNLVKVEWMTVPFYRVLQIITDVIENSSPVSTAPYFLAQLSKQTEIIPKRIKNKIIRLGVQSKYAAIATKLSHDFSVKSDEKLSQHFSVKSMLPILLNIFNIANGYKCLEQCLRAIKPKDYGLIFNNELSTDFVSFAVLSISQDKSLDEIMEITGDLTEGDRMLINAMCTTVHSNENIKTVIHHIIEKAFSSVENRDFPSLKRNVDNIATIIQQYKEVIQITEANLIVKLLTSLRNQAEHYQDFNYAFLNVFKVALGIREVFDKVILLKDNLRDNSLTTVIECRYLILDKQLIEDNNVNELDLKDFLEMFEGLIDRHKENLKEMSSLLSLLENICDIEWFSMWSSSKDCLGIMISATNKLLLEVSCEGDHPELFNFLKILLSSIKWKDENIEWVNHVAKCFQNAQQRVSDKAKFIAVIIEFAESSDAFQEGSLRDFIKLLLIQIITEQEKLTRDQLIDQSVGCEIETEFIDNLHSSHMTINDKKFLRYSAAKVLKKQFSEEWLAIVESIMEDFAKAALKPDGSKRDRYYLNCPMHRMKLHYLQLLVFCETLTNRTIQILINEVIEINNQPNVTYMIEILLAKHRPDFIELLRDESLVKKLKSPALKSFFAIAVLQIRMESSFTLLSENFIGIAVEKVVTAHDIILPFTMGQNYGVRSYAQAAILIMYNHVKSKFGSRGFASMSTIEKTCTTIREAIKFKNASKFIDILKQDFRFTLKFDQLLSSETFYCHLIKATQMPFDEIVVGPGWQKLDELKFKVAEMEAMNPDVVVAVDEIEISMTEESVADTSASGNDGSVADTSATGNEEPVAGTSAAGNLFNLQQKYIPYKCQIPSQRALTEFPSIFPTGPDQQMFLKPESKLIVVASLITRLPNLGGLARTCEVFGVEEYYIDSLKHISQKDFKSLSKSAERWIKISEMKPWQLFDFLLGMKQKGYSIIGAEQSGKSVPLTNVEIPLKSVLLLGNEQTGVPADLLSLLDITIEIPQCGVVRSLNVHVTGSMIIWEYSKQHLFKGNNVCDANVLPSN